MEPLPFQADPTENVKALNEASSRRLDDLQEALKGLFRAELRAIQEVVALNAAHSKEIRDLETARLAAIRQVDIGNQTVAAERLQAATLTLERTNRDGTEMLRSLVLTTATTLADQSREAMAEIGKRIAALELASSEVRGKESLADPMFSRLAEAVESLNNSRALTAGAKGGILAGREWILAAVGLAGGCLGILATAIAIATGIIAYLK
jgi:hypothetical protein